MKHYFFYCIVLIVLVNLISCDKKESGTSADRNGLKGTGSFTYNDYEPFADKPIRVYYHIPASAQSDAPILFVFHGFGRDALASRNDLIAKANEHGFIVIVPKFSDADFEGGDGYNLANIFDDGDNPSASTLNDEKEWTFSVIDPLFEEVKELTGNTTSTYDVFGHSAGAQIAHRFLIYQPEAKINRMIGSASGWYTVPDDQIEFPYGIKSSPAESANLEPTFSKSYTVIVGEEDNDPDSFSLRHNPQADAQGMNRLERAQHFYSESQAIAQSQSPSFNWQYRVVPDVGHDSEALANYAADLLYE